MLSSPHSSSPLLKKAWLKLLPTLHLHNTIDISVISILCKGYSGIQWLDMPLDKPPIWMCSYQITGIPSTL